MKIDGKYVRLRVRYTRGVGWVCVLLDLQDFELGRSPGGSEVDAERYMAHFKKYGAWKQS